jgi:hypothetical protein
MYHCFNSDRNCIFYPHIVYGFRMMLRINSDYFPEDILLIVTEYEFYDVQSACCLRKGQQSLYRSGRALRASTD